MLKQQQIDDLIRSVDEALLAADVAVSAKCVVSNRAGEVLVLLDARSDWADLPGGHVHDGEDFADALAREVREETGLELDPATVARHEPVEQHPLGRDQRPTSVVWYTARAAEPEQDVMLSPEHKGFQWVHPWDLALHNLGVFKARAVALAGASRPVTASTQPGHPFFGNQWFKFARHAAGDPAGPGGPKGRIKHAVLVIGGRRYRGPSHFQALMQWSAQNPKAEGMPKSPLEGFETESGHFLDREQAAEYAAMHDLITDRGEHAAQVERRGELVSEAITMKAIDGLLYTADRVMAAEPVALPPATGDEDHAAVQRVARKIWQAALDDWLNQLGADLHAAFFGAKPMDYDGVVALVAATQPDYDDAVERAAKASYRMALSTLSAKAGVPAEPHPSVLEGYAASRGERLAGLPVAVQQRLRASIARALENGEDSRALARRVEEGLREFQTGRMRVAAETEAQVAYGTAQSEALELAGYTHKRWVTVGDDRVRDSHYLCSAEGAIPVDRRFSNGLRYPGDPDGDVSEVANCRCHLVGERR
jgi:8-oxo-dGTP pyrophosphatase MutT (NUDIX family)